MGETPMTDKTMREIGDVTEEIANELMSFVLKAAPHDTSIDDTAFSRRWATPCLSTADAILAIPKIQEALKLLENADKLAELDEDQSLPPALYHGGDAFTEEAVKNDMLRDRFRRVKVKG